MNLFKNIMQDSYYESSDSFDLATIDVMVKDEIKRELKNVARKDEMKDEIKLSFIQGLNAYKNNLSKASEQEEFEYYYKKGKGLLTEEDIYKFENAGANDSEKISLCNILIDIFESI